MAITLRPAKATDYTDVLRLNENAVPNVNSISENTLRHLHEQSYLFYVAQDSAGLAGFLLALSETASYDSPNFRYFKNRYPQFAYVDRIVVSENHRRLGVGQKLYSTLFEEAYVSKPLITCEVNLVPENSVSMIFHEKLGFREVGQQETEQGDKRVSLLARPKALLKTAPLRRQSG